jgi:hypothetical protein
LTRGKSFSSRRPDFFHAWRDLGSLHLHQAAHPFPACSLIKKEETVAADASAGERTRPRVLAMTASSSRTFLNPFFLPLLIAALFHSALDVGRSAFGVIRFRILQRHTGHSHRIRIIVGSKPCPPAQNQRKSDSRSRSHPDFI